jgi:hypothetical protein
MRSKAVLAALLLTVGCAAAALAGSLSPSPSDQVFVRSLAAPQQAASPAGPQQADPQGVALPDVGVPDPQWKTCTASVDCGDGNSVNCTGNANCHTTIAGVMCDSTEVRCPNFCQISQSCDCCNGPYVGTCWSRRGDCQYTEDGIECNGHNFTCEQMCPLCPEW